MKKMLLLMTTMVILAACSRTNTPATEEKMPAVNVETDQNGQMMEESNENEGAMMESDAMTDTVAVEASNYKFSTNEIRVKQGEKLIVTLTNKEGMHDFVIDDLKVNSGMVEAGTSKEITIPTDTAGTYEFYCSVGNHKQMGMKGTLIIE